MKNSKITFKKLIVLTVFVFSLVMFVPTVSNVSAQAAPKKVVTKTLNHKKCPTVKIGKYKIYSKSKYTVVKFVAPTTGRYSFTAYDLKTLKPQSPDRYLGQIYLTKLNRKNKYIPQKIDLKYGRGILLMNLCTKEYYKSYKNDAQLKDMCILKETGAINLKKGETIYIDTSYVHGAGCSYNLDIKKK